MSTLISCRVCNNPVSSNARFCPHCGERSPEPIKDTIKYGILGFAIVGFIVFILVGIINYLFYR
jgi:hypothetical protein